ncbi:stage V sporulation protein AE [Sporosalibacterium faouarense]|uniref:stage V sporulation protein AE n=1 Tax=Sporosalibacterium faouarense TaxID=516123 RepID=UPI00141CEB2C|nr:stage V sporulation protein AE [Sporosalibacterium faouarense]MTI49177.1 stage V sporulation protein AE [Bacillota bacterium]
MKRKVILVTDGDTVARKAVEKAAKNIEGRCISKSAGNPTPIEGSKIAGLIETAKYDPVVIMLDDVGNPGTGEGELALDTLLSSPNLEVLGIVAVASNTEGVEGIKVNFSIDRNGNVVNKAVDKDGNVTEDEILYGDTVDIINQYSIPLIVGIGDIGKMKGKDDCKKGSPILTKALQEILNRSELWDEKEG